MAESDAKHYVVRLPHSVICRLSAILDKEDQWEVLGREYMQFDDSEIQIVKTKAAMGKSPSEELLTYWGYIGNRQVKELLVLLNKMKQYDSMFVLKPYVEEKYQKIIEKYEEKLKKSSAIQKVPSLKSIRKLSVDNCSEKDQMDKFLTEHTTDNIYRISYEKLTKATNNWDERYILGKGGYGTVYKGIFQHLTVAIKCLQNGKNGENSWQEEIRQSLTELHCLNIYRHENILSLYGYSNDGPHACLLYEFMPGGSLDRRLSSKQENSKELLNWHSRLNIAIGVAKGLQFLHETLVNNRPLVHGDIKSPNILLDDQDRPKIGDFGLAREGPTTDKTSTIVTSLCGTIAYLPPDYLFSKKLNTKVDIFSYGVVLFEIATGSVVDTNDYKFVNSVIKCPNENILDLKDTRIDEKASDEIFSLLLNVGKHCVQRNGKLRPEMRRIVIKLETFRDSPDK